jgi:hypothetical protein
MLTLPTFMTPVTVDSISFKNRGEISDFGDVTARNPPTPSGPLLNKEDKKQEDTETDDDNDLMDSIFGANSSPTKGGDSDPQNYAL